MEEILTAVSVLGLFVVLTIIGDAILGWIFDD